MAITAGKQRGNRKADEKRLFPLSFHKNIVDQPIPYGNGLSSRAYGLIIMASLHTAMSHEIQLHIIISPFQEPAQLILRILLPERMGHIIGNSSVYPGKVIPLFVPQQNFLKGMSRHTLDLLLHILSEKGKGGIIDSGLLAVFMELRCQLDQLFFRKRAPACIQVAVVDALVFIAYGP